VERKIRTAEASLTPLYWALGDTLLALREQHPHGEWLAYLNSLGVNKTRWEKAKAIRETFPTVDACRNLSVEEAYEARQRKQVQDHGRSGDNEDADAQVQLNGLAKAKRVLGAFAKPDGSEDEMDDSDDAEEEPLAESRDTDREPTSDDNHEDDDSEAEAPETAAPQYYSRSEASPEELTAMIAFIQAALTQDHSYEQLLPLLELAGVQRAKFLIGVAQTRIAEALAQGQLTYEELRG
jgi:hypothetical protein